MLYLLFFLSFRDTPTLVFQIKYTPFKTIFYYCTEVIKYDKKEFVENIFGNIILFIPYGFLGILFPKLKQFKWLIGAFFVVINIIEFSQYYLRRGFADIDDVILNSLGVIIGYFIYRKIDNMAESE